MLYAQEKMRSHLLECFEDGVLTKFLTIKERRVRTNRIVNTQLIKVHCVYRMPNIKGLPMICCSACNTWFHGSMVTYVCKLKMLHRNKAFLGTVTIVELD